MPGEEVAAEMGARIISGIGKEAASEAIGWHKIKTVGNKSGTRETVEETDVSVKVWEIGFLLLVVTIYEVGMSISDFVSGNQGKTAGEISTLSMGLLGAFGPVAFPFMSLQEAVSAIELTGMKSVSASLAAAITQIGGLTLPATSSIWSMILGKIGGL